MSEPFDDLLMVDEKVEVVAKQAESRVMESATLFQKGWTIARFC